MSIKKAYTNVILERNDYIKGKEKIIMRKSRIVAVASLIALIPAVVTLPACTTHKATYNDVIGEDRPVEVLPQNGIIKNKAKYEYSGDSKPEYVVVVKFEGKADTETFRVTEKYYESVSKGDKFEYDEANVLQKN